MEISLSQRKAYSEVDEFLNMLNSDYRNKIPSEIREFFTSEKDTTYIKKINPYMSIESQNLMEESLTIIMWLNLEYWATSAEKELLEQMYENNQNIFEEEQKEKYSIDKIFSKKKDENKSIIIYKKESFISKIINKIKSIFKK